MRVLKSKEQQIDELREKIKRIERNNEQFDRLGRAKQSAPADFEFEIEGGGEQRSTRG